MSLIINPFAFASAGGSGPSLISDMWEWWEPWREGLSNNDPMPTLTGQKNGRNFSEPTSANRPVFKTAQINGLAAAQFPGSPKAFSVGPDMSGITSAAHVFILLKVNNDPPASSNGSGLWRLGTDAVDNDHYPFTTGTVYTGALTSARVTTINPTASLTNWHMLEVLADGTTQYLVKILLTGGSSETLYNNTNANGVHLTVSPKLGNSLNSPYLEGYVAGMYLASAKLTTDRATLLAYINGIFATGFA